MTDRELRNTAEAVLFASGASVPVARMAAALELTEKDTVLLLDGLVSEYSRADRGITILKLDGAYQMASKKEYAPQIRTVMDLRRNIPLSQAAFEVLAVVAYNQPVTKAFVEQVRGVDCSGVIGSLTAKDLIEEKGRLELPGRPLVYGTTENFLRCFSISSLSELPDIPDPADSDASADGQPENNDSQLSIFSAESQTDAGEITAPDADTAAEDIIARSAESIVTAATAE